MPTVNSAGPCPVCGALTGCVVEGFYARCRNAAHAHGLTADGYGRYWHELNTICDCGGIHEATLPCIDWSEPPDEIPDDGHRPT